METRRRDASARLVRPAPGAARMADVVCWFGNHSRKSLVRRFDYQIAARLTAREPVACEKSISARTAALRPPRVLSLSFHDPERTPTDRRMVEAPGTSRISPRCVA